MTVGSNATVGRAFQLKVKRRRMNRNRRQARRNAIFVNDPAEQFQNLLGVVSQQTKDLFERHCMNLPPEHQFGPLKLAFDSLNIGLHPQAR